MRSSYGVGEGRGNFSQPVSGSYIISANEMLQHVRLLPNIHARSSKDT